MFEMADKIEEMSFEDAIKKLERIATELEKENTDLDATLKLYEDGIKLLRYCNKTLEDAERRVKLISVSEDGELLEKDFSASGDKEN